jgi:transcriptional regulator with XRE-family HTH domain
MASTGEQHEFGREGVPNVGIILARLRRQRRLSVREVATASGLSPSFISALERGETDIALHRLARLAKVFDHDIGSFLGYSARQAKPEMIDERLSRDRGAGIAYEVIPLPRLNLEIIRARFEPHTHMNDTITHEGIDIVTVLEGEIVLVYQDEPYAMSAGECAVWSGAYPHTFRNDSDAPAEWIAVVTGTVY